MSGEPERAAPERGSGRGLLPWGILVALLLLIALDQWSKAAVFQWLGEDAPGELVRDRHGHPRYAVHGSWLGMMLHTNTGAAFGQFRDYPHLLVGGRILAVLLLSWLLFRSDPRRHGVVALAMLLVLAGAAGNLMDNLWTGGTEEGHPYRTVRDFIDVWFLSEAWGWDWHFPTFNVADSCISVGAVLWVLSGFRREEEHGQEDDGEGEREEAGATPPARVAAETGEAGVPSRKSG